MTRPSFIHGSALKQQASVGIPMAETVMACYEGDRGSVVEWHGRCKSEAESDGPVQEQCAAAFDHHDGWGDGLKASQGTPWWADTLRRRGWPK